MNDHDAFIAAICAKPDDDLPRLIFADWLDDRGEHERAEFIRVQCELESLEAGFQKQVDALPWPNGMGMKVSAIQINPHIDALRRREREFLEKYGAQWASEVLSQCSLKAAARS